MKKQYIRQCSSCGIELRYNSAQSKWRADKADSKCRSCSKIGRMLSEKTKEKIRVFNQKYDWDQYSQGNGTYMVPCPSCGTERIYGYIPYEALNTECRSCAATIAFEDRISSKSLSPWWSKQVKELYENECAVCGSTSDLQAHHILPRIAFPELSLNINNGVCLCRYHHNEFHSLNGKTQMGRKV